MATQTAPPPGAASSLNGVFSSRTFAHLQHARFPQLRVRHDVPSFGEKILRPDELPLRQQPVDRRLFAGRPERQVMLSPGHQAGAERRLVQRLVHAERVVVEHTSVHLRKANTV